MKVNKSKSEQESVVLLIRWILTITLIVFAWRGCDWAVGLLFFGLFLKVEAENAAKLADK